MTVSVFRNLLRSRECGLEVCHAIRNATSEQERGQQTAGWIEEEHWSCFGDTERVRDAYVRLRVEPPPVRRHRTVDQRLVAAE